MRYESRSRERELLWKRVKIYGAAGGVLLLTAGVISLLIKLPLLRVRKIEVGGEASVAANTVVSALTAHVMQNYLDYLLGPQNMLVWGNSVEVNKEALKTLPTLASIEVSRNIFTGTVKINAIERSHTILWCTASESVCYWADQNGILYKRFVLPTSTSSISVAPTLIDYSTSTRLAMLSPALSSSDFANLVSIVSFLNQLGFVNPVIYLKNINYEEVSFKAPQGQELMFSLLFSPQDDLSAVRNLVNSSSWKKIQYIDLRVQDKIYYR